MGEPEGGEYMSSEVPDTAPASSGQGGQEDSPQKGDEPAATNHDRQPAAEGEGGGEAGDGGGPAPPPTAGEGSEAAAPAVASAGGEEPANTHHQEEEEDEAAAPPGAGAGAGAGAGEVDKQTAVKKPRKRKRDAGGEALATSSVEESRHIKERAVAWARREGFDQGQVLEFEYLMDLVAAKHIRSSLLSSSLVCIDKGSFGMIYKTTFGKNQVAVKLLDSRNGGECMIKGRMRDLLLELFVLTRLESHPNIVRFHGTATNFLKARDKFKLPFVGLVFEMCQCGNLQDALMGDKRRQLTVKQKVNICKQVASGLVYLHSKRIIHRDINTRNVLLSKDFTAKIADFGCARMIADNKQVLMTATISGSPAYMSPEQMMQQPLTEATDLWSLAIILWEVAAEQKPYSWCPDFGTLKHAIDQGHRLPMPGADSPFPRGFVEVMWVGMQTHPAQRTTAKRLHEMLQATELQLP